MMRKYTPLSLCLLMLAISSISFKETETPDYTKAYRQNLSVFRATQEQLLKMITIADINDKDVVQQLKTSIENARNPMKSMDFWMRYLEPMAYKLVNGPLRVEWETEVFEKFEKPYRREGAGLTLAALYLNEEHIEKDTLIQLIKSSLDAIEIFASDSVTKVLATYHHFYLCNRLYLLNLAAIYTTGFENPNANRIVPELRELLTSVNEIYRLYNTCFPVAPLSRAYLTLYSNLISFVNAQNKDAALFDHFTFIRDYVNPLFAINQQLILQYKVVSESLADYSLNKNATSIFEKGLYDGQNAKGIFIRVNDSVTLGQIEQTGKLLFYDPILSGNNQRSCASCHKPTQYFTDTAIRAPLHFNRKESLVRNAPSLINAVYNHLIMLDGKHFTLQHQTKEVINNPSEMSCNANEVLAKVLSCKEYKKRLQKLLWYTPQEKEITYDHIVSCITWYYSKFSKSYSPFDNAINKKGEIGAQEQSGFNLFMSKAQCGTCHFVPQFNGVKPPYIGSEFEVLGVPADTSFVKLSLDEGRYIVNPAKETRNAFRTGSIRNAAHTKPYMHNGVFTSLEQVIDFYDAGGGAGRGLMVTNQTLSSDSLKLTVQEKKDLIAFIKSLDEQVFFETPPAKLPKSKTKALNTRIINGTY